MSPGTMLDGRYRLEDLLSEHDGARFWRATDTVLARSVAVHVVPSDDPRAPRVLEAARTSARVTDPHFLRVLDCDDADGLTWVINEWGDGVSLDVMLARGTLPAMRAAWLTREVAEAIVAAHAQGLAHGRLNPEAVLVTEAGAVKLIGFVVNAAFERTPTTGPGSTSPYGPISPREADVVDLAGILYAALTGKWPGVAPSSVPPAPREGSRPLRPRQVRAGVPRTLDAICDRVLDKEASQHSMPVETAHEIAAALSDYVGDPTLVAPLDAPSMHQEPEPPEPVDLAETAVGLLPTTPDGPDAPEVTEIPEAAEAAEQAAADPPVVAPAALGEPVVTPGPPGHTDPEATMASPPPFSSGVEFFEPDAWASSELTSSPGRSESSEPSAPPPPFEQPDARPLFAESERRVPANAPVLAAPTPPAGTGPWAAGELPPTSEREQPRRRRSGLMVALVIAVALAVAAAMYVAFVAGRNDDAPSPAGSTSPASTSGTEGTASASPTGSAPSSTPVPSGAPVTIKAVGDFDPEGDPPSENPGRARLAVDGDPGTAWPTSTYSSATLDGPSGVGLVVDLGKMTSLASVEAQVRGGATDVSFYATPDGDTVPPSVLADATWVGRVSGATSSAVVATPSVRTRYVIVWLTRLPAAGDGFVGQIAEISVRS